MNRDPELGDMLESNAHTTTTKLYSEVGIWASIGHSQDTHHMVNDYHNAVYTEQTLEAAKQIIIEQTLLTLTLCSGWCTLGHWKRTRIFWLLWGASIPARRAANHPTGLERQPCGHDPACGHILNATQNRACTHLCSRHIAISLLRLAAASHRCSTAPKEKTNSSRTQRHVWYWMEGNMKHWQHEAWQAATHNLSPQEQTIYMCGFSTFINCRSLIPHRWSMNTRGLGNTWWFHACQCPTMQNRHSKIGK